MIETGRHETCRGLLAAAGAVALVVTGSTDTHGQITYSRGQNVAPSFEGWMPNPDGTYEIFFGYMNRNFEEHLHIPVGPDNHLEPGGPDRGQPTHFFPRRNRDVFTVTVPADFGEKEVVWTITSNGKTEQAYASLIPGLILDQRIIYRQHTGLDVQGETEHNQIPSVQVEGATSRTTTVGRSLVLAAVVEDDGIPRPRRPMVGRFGGGALGLRVAWFVYRGDGATVSFDPPQFKHFPDFKRGSPWTRGWEPPPLPEDGKHPVQVTFSEPGTFVLRVLAHDGGSASSADVTVAVTTAGQ